MLVSRSRPLSLGGEANVFFFYGGKFNSGFSDSLITNILLISQSSPHGEKANSLCGDKFTFGFLESLITNILLVSRFEPLSRGGGANNSFGAKSNFGFWSR